MNHDTIETIYRTLAVNVSFLTQSRGREQSNTHPVKHIFWQICTDVWILPCLVFNYH